MKRSASLTIRTHPDFHVSVAAFAAAVIATLFLLCAPSLEPAHAQESTQHMPAGMEVGEGGVSIGGGVFAGDGCAKVGELEAGDCGKEKARGRGADGASDESGDADGASHEQYGVEDGSGAGATVLESTTFGDGGSGSGGGESTQTQTIESTTGVVEQGSGAGAEVGPHAGGATGPEGATEQDAPGAEHVDQGCAAEGPVGETTTTTIERIVDGDTVETPEGTVRMIGVDTPETVDPGEPVELGGGEASGFTASELEGAEVELEPGTEPEDDYGRALAYVWTEDESGEPVMFNEVLLREGLAELLVIPPNDEYERCLAAAEKAARDEGVGLWADDAGGAEPVPPDSPSEPEIAASRWPDSSQEDATSDDAPTQDQYAGEGSQPEAAETEDAESEGAAPSAAEGQYEEAASESTPPGPTDEPEIQEPEVREEEVQEERARSSELADAPAELPAEVPVEASTELPTDDASVSTTSAPPASAGAAPITTLPETGGSPVVSLAAGTLLVCSGLLAARLARTPRGPGGAPRNERARS